MVGLAGRERARELPTAHVLIKDGDRKLIVIVEVEDEEVAGHDVVPLAEPPSPAG
jgi:hypothetical protein